MEDETDALNVAPDDALSVLEYWQANAARVMFVYRRSGDALTQIGLGCIQQATLEQLTVVTADGCLRVLVCDAAFGFGALPSFAARHSHVVDPDGLLVCLRNEDRLYLCAADAG